MITVQDETLLFVYLTEILSPGSEDCSSNLCLNVFQLSELYLRHFPDEGFIKGVKAGFKFQARKYKHLVNQLQWKSKTITYTICLLR